MVNTVENRPSLKSVRRAHRTRGIVHLAWSVCSALGWKFRQSRCLLELFLIGQRGWIDLIRK